MQTRSLTWTLRFIKIMFEFKELVEMASKNSCAGCFYWRDIGRCNHQKCCHYMLMTGELRGSSAINCNKKLVISKPDDKRMVRDYVLKTSRNGRVL